jgi:hypothetical protein
MKKLLTVATLALASTAMHAQQRYLCNKGYSPADCKAQYAILKPLLDKYGADKLGPWTWLLVKSDDWASLHATDEDSPAFTSLEKRTTVFDESLLRPMPSQDAVLLAKWQLSKPDLLDLAVTHELGHALCNERDERRADANGKRLRDGLSVTCAK